MGPYDINAVNDLTERVKNLDVRILDLEKCRTLWRSKKHANIVSFYANPWIVVRKGAKLTPTALHLVAIGGEMRAVMNTISPLEVVVVPGTTQEVFTKELSARNPSVVCMSMHHQEKQGLLFEAESGYAQIVQASVVSDALKEAQSVKLLILSVCNGHTIAENVVDALEDTVVIYWDSVVEDFTARDFTVALLVEAYKSVGKGHLGTTMAVEEQDRHNAECLQLPERSRKTAFACAAPGPATSGVNEIEKEKKIQRDLNLIAEDPNRADWRLGVFVRAVHSSIIKRDSEKLEKYGDPKEGKQFVGRPKILFKTASYRYDEKGEDKNYVIREEPVVEAETLSNGTF